VITGSQASAADLVATLGVDPGRLDVVPHGVRSRSIAPSEDVRARLAIGPGPLMLAVAQKRPHKNLTALVRALALLPGMRLVLPGAPTPHEAELRALAEQLGVADRLHLPAWVSEPDLEGLYTEAAVFVLPSFEEGFGLPVLEAMARGVPVACSDIPVLREVGGDAATYFDPHDAAGIVRAVREADGSGGRERAARFTWRRAAEGTLEAYERAVAS
jgi:glycosyltransferase involved in cell wall biosynthesis